MTTNITACNKLGRPAVAFYISGKKVFRIIKITAPVTFCSVADLTQMLCRPSCIF